MTSLLLLRPAPGPQGAPLSPRWPCYRRLWLVPFVKPQHSVFSTSKHQMENRDRNPLAPSVCVHAEWNSRIIKRIIPSFFQVCANNQVHPRSLVLSLARSLFLARLQTCRQESVCIRAFRKACRCHSSSAYPPRRSERKFKSVSVYFNFILCPGWVFVSALWEIQSYLLAGIKSSREKPTVSTAFCLKQITWGGRDWFMSHGSFFYSRAYICLYFSRHWSLYATLELHDVGMDVHLNAANYKTLLSFNWTVLAGGEMVTLHSGV